MNSSSDSVLGQSATYGYDEFSRLYSRTITSGTVQNFSYTYDRWGNRTAQTITAGGSGPQPSVSINDSTNQISSSGFTYDAAGNMTNDSSHSYTYDADGNITAVGGGTTATYVYNALNQRVRSVVGSSTTEYVFNVNGQRVSEWNGSAHAQLKGKYYWGGQPVAYYVPSSAAHFEHQDWLGTERVRTSYNGSVEGTFSSLPFGDGQSSTGTDADANHFAALDHDSESNTEHAQLRQYSNVQGRWLSPDPYAGSYDFSNPQSLNRYVYASNNPLSLVDVQGSDDGPCGSSTGGDNSDAGMTVVGGGAPQGGTQDPCIDDEGESGDGDPGGGLIVYDANGNAYLLNADGSITPLGYAFSTIVSATGDGECDMSSTFCQILYEQSMIPNRGLGNMGPGGGVAPNNGPTVSHCLGVAGQKNGVALSLDAAGIGAGFLPGGDLVVAGAQMGIGVASTINSSVGGDAPGAVTGVFGFQLAAMVPAAKWAGMGAKAIPFLGTALSVASTVRDAAVAYGDYQTCMAGH